MPTPGSGPTDALLRIFADVREHLREIGAPPEWVPESIDVHLAGKPKPITLLVPPAAPVAAAPEPPPGPSRAFRPNDFQERILDALAGKLLTSEELGEAVGDRRRLFRPGGVRELVEARWVKKRPGGGYYMVEDPPEGISEENP